ncbi:hypothetical protein BGX29_006768 [Mortierella sp. GBA35]|nr:hypothetical protein BGX29_006768 [Mortierella sp. GBA35]
MQENDRYHPSGTRPLKDYPGGGSGGLTGRESVEPLNAHSVAANPMLGGGGGGGGSASANSNTSSAIAAGLQDSLYPYEADPSGYPININGVGAGGDFGYFPPNDPTYSQYGWTESEYDNNMPVVDYNDEGGLAYAQYEQEQQDMFRHQLRMLQQQQQEQGGQGDVLDSPVEYYDPRTSTDYYYSPPIVTQQHQQPQHRQSVHSPKDRSGGSAASVSLGSGSAVSTPYQQPIATAMFAPTRNSSSTTAAGTAPHTNIPPPNSSAFGSPLSEPRSVQECYAETENDDAYNTKSEPWASSKRNPQILIPPSQVGDRYKSPLPFPFVSDSTGSGSGSGSGAGPASSPYSFDAMRHPRPT